MYFSQDAEVLSCFCPLEENISPPHAVYKLPIQPRRITSYSGGGTRDTFIYDLVKLAFPVYPRDVNIIIFK